MLLLMLPLTHAGGLMLLVLLLYGGAALASQPLPGCSRARSVKAHYLLECSAE